MVTVHPAAATNFVVTNVNNSGPGSLRQAIIDANNNPGLDTVSFNISGPTLSIRIQADQLVVTDPVVIDGTTQPGFSGIPIVELNGTNSSSAAFFINAPGTTVRGLVINTFHLGAILIGFNGGGSHVEGCYIGIDATGKLAAPNNGPGISMFSSNNVIGGTSVAARNVISGNGGAGVQIEIPCCTGTNPKISGNLIQGNYIGVNAAGTKPIPNQREGIVISTSGPDASVTGTMVGGTAPGAGNVISGNRSHGVFIGSFSTTGNIIQGNLIGTDATGSQPIPNDGDGVRVDIARNNVIGGSEPGAGNIISSGRGGSGADGGNGVTLGTNVNSTGNVLKGNFIGTNAAGSGTLVNYLHGVAVGGSNNTVGGTAPGEGNVIAFSGLDGIVCAAAGARSNSFRGNSIYANGRFAHSSGASIGIDLGTSGPTPNDVGDGDTGPNNLQNFPVITSVIAGDNSVIVKGTLNSAAGTSFSLDFYAHSVCNALSYGEGERPIGSAVVTTDAAGNANFELTFASSIPANQVLTATATDPSGNTSEFSQCSPHPQVGVSVGDLLAAEGDSGTKNFSFPVMLSMASAQIVTVNFSTADGTAKSGDNDYLPLAGSVTIPVGQTSALINIQVVGDTTGEPDETFFVNLTSATNADIGHGQGKGTIVNDEATTGPLELILEGSGPDPGQAAALDSILFLRDPFPVVNSANRLFQSADRNTRVTVLVTNLRPDETPSSLVINLMDSNNHTYDLPAEDVRRTPGVNFTQVTFRLPPDLSPGNCAIKVIGHGLVSNSATLRIRL
jgi:hypothetical protein